MSASHLVERHGPRQGAAVASPPPPPGAEMVVQQQLDPYKLPELTTEAAGQFSPRKQKLDDVDSCRRNKQQLINISGGGGGGRMEEHHAEAAAITGGGGKGNVQEEDDAMMMMMMECDGGGVSAAAAAAQISSSRWPQQEAMALLSIRAAMNKSFRDSTNIKTPLWEQISRKMAEMGYQRTAKKCKEKFENMHKYYKRTKEGKTRKQTDGKHYRFFNELDALFGAKSTSTIGVPSSASHPSHDLDLSVPPPPPPVLELQQPPHHSSPSTISTSSADMSSDPPPPLQSGFAVSVAASASPPLPSASGAAAAAAATSISPPDLRPLHRRPKKEMTKRLAMKKKYVAFFEKAMTEVMRRQEEMQERFLAALERMEMARAEREEEWRKQEMARLSVEQDLRLHDTLVSASRDTSLIGFLHRIVSDPGGGDRPPDEEVRRLQSQSSLLSASFAANSAALSSELISILQQQINLFNSGGGAAQLYSNPAAGVVLAEPKPEQMEIATNDSQLEHAIVPFNNANHLMILRPRSPTPPPPAAAAAAATTTRVINGDDAHHENRGGGGEDDNNSMMTEDDTSCHQLEDKNIQQSAANVGGAASKRWPKQEVVALISIRSELERRFRQPGSKAALWEKVSAELRSLGYDRPPKRCKEKWENINKYFKKAKDSNRSRPEDAKTCPYFHHLNALYKKSLLSTAGGGGGATLINSTAGAGVPDNVSSGDDPCVNPSIDPAPPAAGALDNSCNGTPAADRNSKSPPVLVSDHGAMPEITPTENLQLIRCAGVDHSQTASGFDDAEILPEQPINGDLHHQEDADADAADREHYLSDERRGHIREDSSLDGLAAASYSAANGN